MSTLRNSNPEFCADRSRLALSYDVARLQQEAQQAIEGTDPYIYYSVIPLTYPGERNHQVQDFSDPDWTTWEQSGLLRRCHYFLDILASLQCRTTNVRLLRLQPTAVVKEHTDPQLDLALDNQVRLHVPIFTDDRVDFRLNDRTVPLQPGELWYLRLSDPHSVHNNSDQERIQLSIDVVVNRWVREQIVMGDSNGAVGSN